MESRLGKRLGTAILGAAIASGAGVAAEITTDSSANAGGERTISCNKFNRWEGVSQGETIRFKANAGVLPADVVFEGEEQFDNDPDTASVVGFRSKNGSVKEWSAEFPYGGSAYILRCKSTIGEFDKAYGAESRRSDKKFGPNDPIKRVNSNFVSK